MFIWTAQPPRADPVGEASPLLTHLAADFAPRVAGLWPQPHRAFIEAAAERRHLVCLALTQTSGQLAPDLASAAIAAPFRRAVKQVAPNGPRGLARALGRLGEIAWPAGDYLALVEMLGHAGASGALRHRDKISPACLRSLAALSDPLLDAGLWRMGLSGPQAELLTQLQRALAARDGDEAAAAAAHRWAAAGSIPDVCMRAIAAVRRELPPPPFAGSERLRPIRTLAQLDEAGGRFHNCLGALGYAGDPDYAWYEWAGPPGVMIEIMDDRLWGWTLRQARLVRNAAVPSDTRVAITAELRAMGVHVGMASYDVVRALREARNGKPHTTVEQAVGECYGDDD